MNPHLEIDGKKVCISGDIDLFCAPLPPIKRTIEHFPTPEDVRLWKEQLGVDSEDRQFRLTMKGGYWSFTGSQVNLIEHETHHTVLILDAIWSETPV